MVANFSTEEHSLFWSAFVFVVPLSDSTHYSAKILNRNIEISFTRLSVYKLSDPKDMIIFSLLINNQIFLPKAPCPVLSVQNPRI